MDKTSTQTLSHSGVKYSWIFIFVSTAYGNNTSHHLPPAQLRQQLRKGAISFYGGRTSILWKTYNTEDQLIDKT